ncbi:MAG: M48 family metallopeptidase [archaeon]
MVEHLDFRDQVARNKWQSFLLIFIVFVLVIAIISVIGLALAPFDAYLILIIATIIAVIYVLISYSASEKIVLSSVKAVPADPRTHSQLISSVEGLSMAAGIPKPKVFVMPGNQINAFATGKNPEKGIVCVTEGALTKLSKHELEGVLAHELSHIKHYDIRFMTLAVIMVGLIAIISQIFLRSLWFGSGNNREGGNVIFLVIGIVLAIVAPIVAMLVQLAISRKREFMADAGAVEVTRYPEGLINALTKIKSDSGQAMKVSSAVSPLFISNPFRKKELSGLLSTHPPIEDRIKALQAM